MALGIRAIRQLREALPVGSIIQVIKRNGRAVHDYINNKGYSIGIHHSDSIDFFSPHTGKHWGEIFFENYDTCSISKTNITLDSCIIAIKKRGLI